MLAHNSKILVLKQIKFRETSVICKVFSEDKGLISLICRGYFRPKNRLRGSLEPGTFLDALLIDSAKSELYVIQEAQTLYSVFDSNHDYRFLHMASIILRIGTQLEEAAAYSAGIFQLMDHFFRYLAQQKTIQWSLLWIFLRRLFDEVEQPLDFRHCHHCGQTIQQQAHLYDHYVLCETCADQEQHNRPLQSWEWMALRKIIQPFSAVSQTPFNEAEQDFLDHLFETLFHLIFQRRVQLQKFRL